MASIGGVSTLMVKGEGVDNSERLDIYQVPGHDGYGAQKLGQGDSRWAFRGIHIDTLANVNTWIGLMLSAKSAVISIVDDFGTTHTNLLVNEVTFPQRQVVYYNATLLVRVEMVLRGIVR